MWLRWSAAAPVPVTAVIAVAGIARPAPDSRPHLTPG